MDLLNSYGDEDDTESPSLSHQSVTGNSTSSSSALNWNNSLIVHTLKSDITVPIPKNDANYSVDHMFKPSNNIMYKGQSVKILMIGPVQAGKSTISNFLADREDILQATYRPTAGVRIVEFEKEAPKNPRRPGQEKVLIELWDVSGDVKYFCYFMD